jgi:hypothetical protein
MHAHTIAALTLLTSFEHFACAQDSAPSGEPITAVDPTTLAPPPRPARTGYTYA